MILILTCESDTLQPFASEALRARGARVVRFNTAEFPQSATASLRFNDAGRTSSLRIAGERVELDEITTVWYRRPTKPLPDPRLSALDQEFARGESEHVLTAIWHSLRDRFWVNPYDASRAAEHKPYQLQVAQRVGFDVPRTLITNDPDEVMAFLDSCSGGVVYKGLQPHSRRTDDTPYGLFTSRVERERVCAQLEQVRLAPCIFQEYVPKHDELRVTVMGDRIFTCAIDSQASEVSRVDWRKATLVGLPAHRPADVPDDIRAKIAAMTARLGLVFGCFDFVRTPDGRVVFLEVNPNGQWYWVERATGMRLMEGFVDLLTSRERSPAHPIGSAAPA